MRVPNPRHLKKAAELNRAARDSAAAADAAMRDPCRNGTSAAAAPFAAAIECSLKACLVATGSGGTENLATAEPVLKRHGHDLRRVFDLLPGDWQAGISKIYDACVEDHRGAPHWTPPAALKNGDVLMLNGNTVLDDGGIYGPHVKWPKIGKFLELASKGHLERYNDQSPDYPVPAGGTAGLVEVKSFATELTTWVEERLDAAGKAGTVRESLKEALQELLPSAEPGQPA